MFTCKLTMLRNSSIYPTVRSTITFMEAKLFCVDMVIKLMDVLYFL